MIIRALLNFYLYYGDNFKIECPTGSGKMMNLFEVTKEIADRLSRIFLRDERGRRPVYGGTEKFQTDPHWRDHILFYEYFHGDNGAGLGASHQTGWTGLVAKIIQLYGLLDPKRFLEGGKEAGFVKGAQTPGGKDMKTWPKHPVIYEINTWVWLGELSRKYRRPVTLATVPPSRNGMPLPPMALTPCGSWASGSGALPGSRSPCETRGSLRISGGPSLTFRRRTMSARPTACAATSLTNTSAVRRGSPPHEACCANAGCG